MQGIEHECRAIPEGETIFVSMASYRDPQCPETVFDVRSRMITWIFFEKGGFLSVPIFEYLEGRFVV